MADELLDRLRGDVQALKLSPRTIFRHVHHRVGKGPRSKLTATPRTCSQIAKDIEQLIQLWERK